MSTPVATLVQTYLNFAATEVNGKGKVRAYSTMSSYRKALAGFVTAVEESGLELAQLPEDFIETKWLATQGAVINQSVQLRIRATAVSMFQKWLFINNIPCAPLRNLKVTTPPPKQHVAPEEQPMSNVTTLQDVSQLGDLTREEGAVPATQSYAPPVMQPAVPLPQPRQPQQAPQVMQKPQPVARVNPLAGMLPTAQFKLRVRRERDGDEDVFVGDYLSDRVRMAGAIEPFLAREVGPTLAKQGVYGDVSFIVCAVSPTNVEGDKTRYTINVPGGPAQVAAAPMQQVQQASTREELLDVLTTSRRATEELEERLTTKLGTQQSTERGNMSEMDEMRAMMRQMAGTIQTLAERIESRDSRREEPAPASVQQAAPQLDILKVMEFADSAAARRNQPAAPAAPPMGLTEVLGLMAQAKTIFQPQNIQVDTTPMEDKLDKTLALLAAKPKGLIDTLKEFKEAKELFQMVGGEVSGPKPTGFGATLGAMFMKFIENPAPIAEAAERVLNAARGAAQTPPTQPQFPPQVIAATNAVLGVQDPSALVLAVHEWMKTLSELPAFVKPVQRLSELARNADVNGFGLYLQQVFKALGAQVPPDKCANIAQVLISQLPKPQLAAPAPEPEVDEAEGEDDDEGEGEDEGPVDMTIRVGGAEPEESDDDDADADGDDDAPDEAGSADEDGAEQDEAPDDAAEAARAEEAGEEGPAIEASAEEIEEAVTETKSERRKRRKAEKEASMLPAEVQKFDKPTARG